MPRIGVIAGRHDPLFRVLRQLDQFLVRIGRPGGNQRRGAQTSSNEKSTHRLSSLRRHFVEVTRCGPKRGPLSAPRPGEEFPAAALSRGGTSRCESSWREDHGARIDSRCPHRSSSHLSLRISASAPYSPALLKPETCRNIILAIERTQQQSTFEPCRHLAYSAASSSKSRDGQHFRVCAHAGGLAQLPATRWTVLVAIALSLAVQAPSRADSISPDVPLDDARSRARRLRSLRRERSDDGRKRRRDGECRLRRRR